MPSGDPGNVLRGDHRIYVVAAEADVWGSDDALSAEIARAGAYFLQVTEFLELCYMTAAQGVWETLLSGGAYVQMAGPCLRSVTTPRTTKTAPKMTISAGPKTYTQKK